MDIASVSAIDCLHADDGGHLTIARLSLIFAGTGRTVHSIITSTNMMTKRHLIITMMLTATMVTGCTDQDVAQGKIDSTQAKLGEHNTGASRVPRSPSGVTAPYNLKVGRSVFTEKCLSCHRDGIKGAPKLGEVAEWTDRVAQDLDILIQHAINGHGRMPPKGGFTDLSDAQVASAVAYVVNKSERLIKVADVRRRATECHPINNPSLCTKEELRDALTLHMMWLLRTKDRGP